MRLLSNPCSLSTLCPYLSENVNIRGKSRYRTPNPAYFLAFAAQSPLMYMRPTASFVLEKRSNDRINTIARPMASLESTA